MKKLAKSVIIFSMPVSFFSVFCVFIEKIKNE